jgi:hypothetical protein
MYLQKVISKKNCVKKLVFAGILKVNDENNRIRFQDSDPDPPQNVMDPQPGSPGSLFLNPNSVLIGFDSSSSYRIQIFHSAQTPQRI